MNSRDTARWIVGSALARYRPYGLFAALQTALAGCRTVLDVGCGSYSIMRYLTRGRSVTGLDRHEPSLKANRNLYAHVVEADILDCPFRERSFDAVVSLDVIEHLAKEDGERMLATMEMLARTSVVVYTPNGFLPQPASPDNPWQEHRSGWTPAEFRARGYRVFGINGLKRFRGDFGQILRRPFFFWELASRCSRLQASRRPEAAFALCAVRRKPGR
jgi:SAM-dependent methyltransferase